MSQSVSEVYQLIT